MGGGFFDSSPLAKGDHRIAMLEGHAPHSAPFRGEVNAGAPPPSFGWSPSPRQARGGIGKSSLPELVSGRWQPREGLTEGRVGKRARKVTDQRERAEACPIVKPHPVQALFACTTTFTAALRPTKPVRFGPSGWEGFITYMVPIPHEKARHSLGAAGFSHQLSPNPAYSAQGSSPSSLVRCIMRPL